MTKRGEPERLKRGKAFHKKIQQDWEDQDRAGDVTTEKPVRKPSGRRGRIDVHVAGDPNVGVGVGEIKATDWDRMTDGAVRRNVRRQARQVWDYIESQREEGHAVSPAVIFPARPRSEPRLRLVESLFDQELIAVVWDDETIEQRKERARREDGSG